MTTALEVDFVIVGAGPIGSALALALSEISDSVVLVDQAQPQDFPLQGYDSKVFAINSGSRQLFERLDLWKQIESQRLCAYDRMHVWDAQGTGSVNFDAAELGRSQLGHIIESGVIQNAIDHQISQTSAIQMVRPVTVVSVEKLDQGSLVQLSNGQAFLARLVCAADGARSSLRRQASIDTKTQDCKQKALVASVQISRGHQSCAWQIFHSTGPLAFLPLPSEKQDQCSIVWSLDTNEAARVEALGESEFLLELERAIEGRFGDISLTGPRRSFPLYQIHAAEYGQPGLVLVGDAAHSIHPLAGLGANLGFQDVEALSRELVRAKKRSLDYGHPSVISRYQRKRRLDNELVLQAMAFFKDSFSRQGMVVSAARNMGLKLFSNCSPLKKAVARQAFMS